MLAPFSKFGSRLATRRPSHSEVLAADSGLACTTSFYAAVLATLDSWGIFLAEERYY
jgi:hypothetical protein